MAAPSVRAVLGTTFDTNSGSHTVTATPAADDLIIIFCANTGVTTTPTVSDNNSDGAGAYSLRDSALGRSSADKLFVFVRNAKVGSATSTVFTVTGVSSTGGGLTVLALAGMSKVGTSTDRQSAVQANHAGGSAPAPAFGVAALTTSIIVGAVLNAANPAGLSERSSPVYTERADVGFNSPTTGMEVMSINSGETATTITWGSSSTSAYASIAVEVNTANDGTVAITLAALTSVATGTGKIQGTSAKTLAALTSSATGTGKIQGVLTKTLAALTGTNTGTVKVQGSATKTLAALAISATGTGKIQGTVAKTLGAVTASATGTSKIQGAVAKTLAALTSAATGTSNIKGALDQTLASVSPAATGAVSVKGALAQSLAAASLSAAGAVPSQGTLSVTLSALTSVATGTGKIQGTLAKTLAVVTVNAAGTGKIQGTSAKTLADVTLAATGTASGSTAEGVLNQTLADASLAATAAAKVQGSTSRTLAALTVSAAGSVKARAVLTQTLESASSAGTGTVRVRGAASVSLGNVTSDAAGIVQIRGTFTRTLQDLTVIGTITVDLVTGTLAQTLGPLLLVASGTLAASNLPVQLQIDDVSRDVVVLIDRSQGDVMNTDELLGAAFLRVGV